MIRNENKNDLLIAQELSDRMTERAIKMGGTISGEHGIGIGKIKFMEREHGHATSIMRAIKTALDPNNILNPGKIFS